jgi:hypothetical protein
MADLKYDRMADLSQSEIDTASPGQSADGGASNRMQQQEQLATCFAQLKVKGQPDSIVFIITNCINGCSRFV